MRFTRVFLALLVLTFSFSLLAADVQKFKWTMFKLSHQSAFQSNKQYYSAALDWNPHYIFAESFSMGLDLGGSLLKRANKNMFFAPEYLLKANVFFNPNFSLGLGGGFQWWINNGGTFFTATADLAYIFTCNRPSIFQYVNNIFMGYYYVNSDLKRTHIARVGIGFLF
ncbi:MAG: hypothetical protein HQK49_03325 [Oligoflexia bacterium]|nr:hypothetical protein [Oligoflexia bacterium]